MNPPLLTERLRKLVPLTLLTSSVAVATALLVLWRVSGEASGSGSLFSVMRHELPPPVYPVPSWGELYRTPIVTEKPEEFIEAAAPMQEPTEWVFAGETATGVRSSMEKLGLPGAVTEALLDPAVCSERDGAFVIRPTDAFLLGLTSEHRRMLYKELRRRGAGHFVVYPFTFPAGKLPAMLVQRVRPETKAIVEKLLYRIGKADCFSDLGPAFRCIPDEEERRHLLKTLTRQETLLLKAVIRPTTNVEQLMAYWSTPGRRKDLQPLLDSLTRVPGGAMLDVAHLIPSFARQRLYTYPEQAPPGQKDFDCHWTCLNFFSSEPNMTYLDSATVADALKRHYDPLPEPGRLGDVILLTTDGENVVHSCVYIADDVVFTKNGANAMQPWTFMTLPEMEVIYPSDEPYRKLVYRMKGM